MEIVPAIERRAWLSILWVESSAGPPERKAAMTITGNPRTLRKKRSPRGGNRGRAIEWRRTSARRTESRRVCRRSREKDGPDPIAEWWNHRKSSAVYRAKRSVQATNWSLEPAAALEIDVRKDPGNDDDQESERIGPGLVELRHVMEVHAPDRSEQSRRQEHNRGHRHDLDDVVLLVVDEAQ